MTLFHILPVEKVSGRQTTHPWKPRRENQTQLIAHLPSGCLFWRQKSLWGLAESLFQNEQWALFSQFRHFSTVSLWGSRNSQILPLNPFTRTLANQDRWRMAHQLSACVDSYRPGFESRTVSCVTLGNRMHVTFLWLSPFVSWIYVRRIRYLVRGCCFLTEQLHDCYFSLYSLAQKILTEHQLYTTY